MGEWLKPDYVILPYQALHNDLSQCHVSSWQQFTLGRPGGKDGQGYFTGDGSDPDKVELTSSVRFLRQYFRYIRPGAVRIEAASDNTTLEAVAFINQDGGYAVVVQSKGGAAFTVDGLPAGMYGRVYTTGSECAARLPDGRVGAGQSLQATIPASGVLTIYTVGRIRDTQDKRGQTKTRDGRG